MYTKTMKRSHQALLMTAALITLAAIAIHFLDRVETPVQADEPRGVDMAEVDKRIQRLEIQMAELEVRVEDQEGGSQKLNTEVSDQAPAPANPWEDWGTRTIHPEGRP